MPHYTDIFVPGGFPRYTYNPRGHHQLEERLVESRHNLCKLTIVTGQTKSGKTVLTRKVFDPLESVWVDGGSIGMEEDLWAIIIDELQLVQIKETTRESALEVNFGAEGKKQLELPLIAKASGGLSIAGGRISSSGERSSRHVSSRVVALSGLKQSGKPLVIDDFHYIDKNLQGSIVRALKRPIFDGLPVVIIAIPHRRYDAVKVEREMTGRINPIHVTEWDEGELSFIPNEGFGMMKYVIPSGIQKMMCTESFGSPHLMQEFCRGLCRERRMELSSIDIRTIDISNKDLEKVFRFSAETIGRPIFDRIAKGPRQRSDRKSRTLKAGEKVDIYQLIMLALAHIKPGLVTLEYEDLRAAIRAISADEIPQLHEVARVLKHMATIAATDASSTPVIDFEEDDKKLHVMDPFFAFFLRWGNMNAS